MNITEELNNYKKDNLCPIKDNCLFYQKPQYHSTTEKEFLVEYCLKGGEGCGLKRNYDRTSELRKKLDFPRDKRTWRSK